MQSTLVEPIFSSETGKFVDVVANEALTEIAKTAINQQAEAA
jgi:hypothetical protein